MKITVISGTEKKGVTAHLKDVFLTEFSGAEITEFVLPRDCPAFCAGCTSCFLRGEQFCKDADFVQKIEEAMCSADLIVLTSPVYVFHATGAMKNMLDHFGYRWMVHRPHPAMFGKRAVIITQCLGAGAKSAAKDMKDSLSFWGISDIGVFRMPLMEDIIWEHLSGKRKQLLESNARKLGHRYAKKCRKPCTPSLLTRIKFSAVRMMQKSVYRSHPDSLDASYWKKQGWLDGGHPW